ncbi:hypothetical protein BDR03DRAFT_441549 [Suillus americanus]|nr:hypothetical protein BDR03DRAFT_441549 [Suillus americanus]
MPLHACLLVEDILRHIFSDIYYVSSPTEGDVPVHYWDRSSQPHRGVARHSLAGLSRVCRFFKDIALDVLWAELENLEPLFRCLPQDLWTETGSQKLLMRRPVTKADWSVFERYASRVQVLAVWDTGARLFSEA